MSESDPKSNQVDEAAIVFELESIVSSGEMLESIEVIESRTLDFSTLDEDEGAPDAETLSPVLKELVSVELPGLEKENRARLQMQSPNRLFFYWSMKNSPYQILNRAFGGNTGNYTLAVKLVNLLRDSEELYPVEAEGSWWFSVDSDSTYRAEIGFYAPNRPFVRAMFSNTVTTPRKRPSPHAATAADWNISAKTFSNVLDASGFKRDAFDVATAGDTGTTQIPNFEPFSRFIERDQSDFAGIASDELRYALFLIASGVSIEHLRYRIDASLFELLQASAAKLDAANALVALKEQFGIEVAEPEEEGRGETVYGSSLVNFPSRFKRKQSLPDLSDYRPLSS